MRADDQRFCDHCGSAYTQLPKANRRQRYCSSLCASRAENKAMKAAPLRAARSRARDRWYRMIDRCANPENDHWHRYGGRGIAVCDRWQDFDAYYTDTGDAPPGMSLDRIDNNGPYAPDNVRWATLKTQRSNIEADPQASKTHCAHGHAYDAENTYVSPRGWRECRACHREKQARRRAAIKEGSSAA